MTKMIRYIWVIIAVLAGVGMAQAQTIVRKSGRELTDTIPKVIVAGDTIDAIIPQRNLGRFDRGLFNHLFVPRNKWGFGITASYGELQTEDVQLLTLLTDLNIKGKLYSVNPSLQYFFASNQSVGMRVEYSRGTLDLEGLSLNLGDDMSFSISDMSYYQQSLSVGTIYRNYVGLDSSGRFGVFNEVDLTFGSGSSRFKRMVGDEPDDTRTTTIKGSINFSPGVCIFIQDYVSFQLSFGVFGLQWAKEHQSTNGVDEGTRVTSGANFRFNIFNIKFGLMVVI